MSKGYKEKFGRQEALASRLERLSPVKRRLLERHLESRSHSTTGNLQEVVDSTAPASLSYNQLSLWLLDRLLPNSARFNVYRAWRIEGAIDLSALDAALQFILDRHQVLKMRVRESSGVLVQKVDASARVSAAFMDLENSSAHAREKLAMESITREAGIPFNLSTGPFLRAMLVKLADDQYVLLIVLHHIASDGWSCRVFRDELTHCYASFTRGETPELPDLPFQYVDFVRYQRAAYSGKRREVLLGYWREQLSGSQAPLGLPTDFPRPAKQSDRGEKLQFDLGPEIFETARIFCREHEVTLFMLLSTVLNVLLHRYTGAFDISIGSPIANRTLPELESLIGIVTNVNVLRTDLSGNPGFLELLQRVKKNALDAYSHQEMPFEELVAELNQERDLSYTPLYQVEFVLQNTPDAGLHFPDASVTPIKLSNGTSKIDLSLCMHIRNGTLSGFWEYCTDLFKEETMKHLAGQYRNLLAGALAEPHQPIARLPLMSDAEQCQLLQEWNATAADYPGDQCVHQLFEEQAARTPDAIAVVFKGQQLTYNALNRRANQLAQYLRNAGVKTDTLVGIAASKSLELIIGILAILKAGGAYVPLDLSYPRERLRFMIEDADLPLLLTHSSLTPEFDFYSGQLLCLDKLDAELDACSPENLESSGSSSERAYVMYTSGSTGQPKGVEIRHFNISRLVFNVQYARLDERQNFLLLAPLSFDASTFELWGALLHGARCVIYPEAVPDLDTLQRYIREYQISILWLTASLFNTIIEQRTQLLAPVAQILTGGEALSVKHIRRAQKELPDSQLINGYGPTESTTFACCYLIPKNISRKQASIPIGRPIANTRAYILDKNLQPVPVGVAGELCLGGDGLARGYLNRPEQTAEKFIHNPFSADPLSRLYQTGDLVRYLPDGNIEFVGRIDHQVKLRGYRIEPGEIETTLMQHPAIGRAVVILSDEQAADKRLVAYLTSENTSPDRDELREFLSHRLPDYMLPSAFVILDQLPLTPNGKIDRDALPPPDGPESLAEATYTAPRNSTEQRVAEIWQGLLKLERVGMHDNFFALGGHSLLAFQVINRLEESFDTGVPLHVIFTSPSIEELAAYLDAERDASNRAASSIPGIGERESGLL